jgi:hypothetical protein
VGQVAVEADRDAEPGGRVHDREDHEVAPAQGVGPGLPDDHAEGEERDRGDGPGGDPVEGLVSDRLYVVASRLFKPVHSGG